MATILKRAALTIVDGEGTRNVAGRLSAHITETEATVTDPRGRTVDMLTGFTRSAEGTAIVLTAGDVVWRVTLSCGCNG